MTDESIETARTAARVPILPILRASSLGLRSTSPLPTLLDGRHHLLLTSGRAGLALAFQQLGIGPNDEILVPAYHCLAMTAPIHALRAKPVFYRLTRGLGVELADLEARAGPRTRCVIVVHYFGFPEPLAAVRDFCDLKGYALIEDCAHAFYGPRVAEPIGRTGDFAIGSVMKFFPVFDGGCLVSFRRELARPRLASGGFMFQLKALFAIIERSGQWTRAFLPRLFTRLVTQLTAAAKKTNPQLATHIASRAPAAATGGLGFEQRWASTRMSLPSRLTARFGDHARNIARRRQNYLKYLHELVDVPAGAPFRSDLPDGVVPYVFPFVLVRPEASFAALRDAGVPMYRWEDVAGGICPTAEYYRTHLVQFPCHQELTDEQVDGLIATIRQVLGATAPSPAGAR